jgi:Tfp pilus assembly protein PilF
MKSIECRGYLKYSILPALLLSVLLSLTACTSPEKAKAEHVSRGEAFLKAEKYQEASIEFRNAIQLDEKFAAGHWGLARAYEGLQRAQEMYDELRTTVGLDANNLEARIKLGNYDMQLAGRYPEALAEAEKLAKEILQKDANHIEGHILMANVLFARNQKDQALAELNHAIDLDPKRAESRLALARYYIASNDKAKAEETYRNAIALNGSSALAHTEFGKFR